MTVEDKHTLDLGALAILAGVLGNMLPTVVSLFSLVWIGLRIYETDTVRAWLGKEKK